MQTNKKSIVAALMVAMFLAAVEGTIVTTAVPTIAKDLHGYDLISFVFSAYLLASAVSTPIYGKLSDMYGRKHTLSVGILIFITGSAACGLSGSMTMLIICRAVQGLGAGAIFTVSYTIVGDIFTLEERPKVQGSLNTVWGIASLAGPFLGGFLIDTLSWHWVFFINLPFGLLSVVLLQRSLKETPVKMKHTIDYRGAVILTLSMLIFMSIFLLGESFGLNRAVFVALSAAAAALLLIAFWFLEKRAREPIVPFDIFTKTSTLVNIVSFLAAAVLIGNSVYMPIYIQNVLGYNATVSGLSGAPASITWLLSSVIMGKFLQRIGAKTVTILSSVLLLISTLLMASLGAGSPLVLAILSSIVMGAGMGGAYTTMTIVVQASVGYHKRGAATAFNALVKTLGQTIGVSVFGGIFNGLSRQNTSIAGAVHGVFLLLIAVAVLCILLTLLLPRIVLTEGDRAPGNAEAEAE